MIFKPRPQVLLADGKARKKITTTDGRYLLHSGGARARRGGRNLQSSRVAVGRAVLTRLLAPPWHLISPRRSPLAGSAALISSVSAHLESVGLALSPSHPTSTRTGDGVEGSATSFRAVPWRRVSHGSAAMAGSLPSPKMAPVRDAPPSRPLARGGPALAFP